MSDDRPAPTLAGVAQQLLDLLETGSHLHPATAARIRRAYDDLVTVERARQQVMVEAVRADLADIDVSKALGGRTYRAQALWLADVIDKRGTDDGPSTTAKLADQLTKVMGLLTTKGGPSEGGGDTFDDWSKDVSTPAAGG